MLSLLLVCFVKQKAKLGKGNDVRSGTLPQMIEIKLSHVFPL
jgi:hypothetical protein